MAKNQRPERIGNVAFNKNIDLGNHLIPSAGHWNNAAFNAVFTAENTDGDVIECYRGKEMKEEEQHRRLRKDDRKAVCLLILNRFSEKRNSVRAVCSTNIARDGVCSQRLSVE
jgi:hypothetical protein